MQTTSRHRAVLAATLLIASPAVAQSGESDPDPQRAQAELIYELKKMAAAREELMAECEQLKQVAAEAKKDRDRALDQLVVEKTRFNEFRQGLMQDYAEAIEKRERDRQTLETKWDRFEKWMQLKDRLADSPGKLAFMRDFVRAAEDRFGKESSQVEEARRELQQYEAELPGLARQFAELEQELTGRWPLTGEAAKQLPPEPEPKPLDPALLEPLDDSPPRTESKSSEAAPPKEESPDDTLNPFD